MWLEQWIEFRRFLQLLSGGSSGLKREKSKFSENVRARRAIFFVIEARRVDSSLRSLTLARQNILHYRYPPKWPLVKKCLFSENKALISFGNNHVGLLINILLLN
jgi:hypothetical protein